MDATYQLGSCHFVVEDDPVEDTRECPHNYSTVPNQCFGILRSVPFDQKFPEIAVQIECSRRLPETPFENFG